MNVGFYGMMAPSPQYSDIDNLRPRLLYARLRDLWTPQEWTARLWLYGLAACLLLSALLLACVWRRLRHTARMHGYEEISDGGDGKHARLHYTHLLEEGYRDGHMQHAPLLAPSSAATGGVPHYTV